MAVWTRRMLDVTFWLCHPLGRSKSIEPAAPAACCELGCGSITAPWEEIGPTPASPPGWAEGAGAAVDVSAMLGGAALGDASGAGAAVSCLPQAARLNRSRQRVRA